MAFVTLNNPNGVNMAAPVVFYGYVLSNTSTEVTISDGTNTSIYYGTNLTYNDVGVTGGTVTGYSELYNGVVTSSVTGISLNAVTVYNDVQNAEILSLDALALAGNDTITASAGNNTITAYGGSNVVTASGGTNTEDFASNFVQYSAKISGSTLTLTGPGETDQITGVQKLQFADQLITSAVGSLYTAAGAISLYNANTSTRFIQISDSAANIAANIDSLRTLAAAGAIYSIALTDAGTPTLQITAAQQTSDSGVLSLITTPHSVQTQSPNTVTVRGAASGTILSYTFADTISAAAATAAVAPLNTQIAASQATPLVLAASGSFAIPTGDLLAAVNGANPVTLFGGSANGQLVIAGSAGLAFNAGSGAGSVFATGGNDLVATGILSGNQYIQLGNGNDTIEAVGANNTITGGTGTNEYLLGVGNNVLTTDGNDLIAGGAGAATITAGNNSPTVFLGEGNNLFNAGTGHATIVGTAGAYTIKAQGGTQIWLGSKSDDVISSGADTIIGSVGAATVNASGNDFLFAGIGQMNFINAAGAQTILGSSIGTLNITGGAGSVIALSYGNTQFTGGSGAATIAGFGGSLTVQGGSGSGLYLAGTAGNSSITGGSGQSIILGTANGDVLTAGSGSGDVIEAGAGAETINAAASTGKEALYGGSGADLIKTGAGSTNVLVGAGATTLVAGSGTDLFAFTSGHANQVTIQNFSSSRDYLSLVGFSSGAATTALASATTSGGSEQITLSDGTHITFQGFTGLTTVNFL